jgi:hypothetical protein
MSSDLINEIETHHSQNKHGLIFGEEYLFSNLLYHIFRNMKSNLITYANGIVGQYYQTEGNNKLAIYL